MAKAKARRRVTVEKSPAVVSERKWFPVPDPAPGSQNPIYMSFPAPPDDEALSEAKNYLATLESAGQIAREPGRPASGTTHQIETDADGRRCLVRKRFSIR